ncbi:MAG: hypothetical protein NDJ65_03385 [Paludibacteraceae bacterium]|nr:hypothetical protein [Paludibacteraceae bacterium]
MKEINLKDAMNKIAAFKGISPSNKPVIFWFHSNQDIDYVKKQINDTPAFATMEGHPLKGHEHMVLKNGEKEEIVKISDHPELLEKFIFPSSKREYTKLFIYHRYLNQLDRDALLYCLDMVNIGKYPVICLINDYSLENDKPSEALLSFINEYFEQYDIV